MKLKDLLRKISDRTNGGGMVIYISKYFCEENR